MKRERRYVKRKTDDVESCKGYPYEESHIARDVDGPDDSDDPPDTDTVLVPEELIAAIYL